MLDLTGKTYKELLFAMLNRVPNTYDKRDTSPIPTALGPVAWALEGFYLALYSAQSQAYIQTAAGESLDLLSVIAGVSRKEASPAVRLGIFNAAVPIGSRFSTVNGAESINFTVTAQTDAANQYQLTAETPGSIGNDYVGPILPITTIPGLTSAQITDILVPGEDTETDGALRERIITALNERPYGGNIAMYKEICDGIDGVGGVQVWPTWNGGGTVKLSVLGADTMPASSTLVQQIKDLIDPDPGQGLGIGYAPIGSTVTVVAPTTVTADIAATLTLTAGITLDQVKPLIQAKLEDYLKTTRQSWMDNIGTNGVVAYNADVYLSRISAAVLQVPGVLNVTGATINGEVSDLALTQTGQTQQVAVLGEVALSV